MQMTCSTILWRWIIRKLKFSWRTSGQAVDLSSIVEGKAQTKDKAGVGLNCLVDWRRVGCPEMADGWTGGCPEKAEVGLLQLGG